MRHTVLYVPGLGDRKLRGRQRLLSTWHYRNLSIEVCSMDWTIQESWETKLQRLLNRVDELTRQGQHVSLIGESAGASAVICALSKRTDVITAVILLCGKSQFPERVSSLLYKRNPAFKYALTESSLIVPKLSTVQKSKLLNLHPIADFTVPVWETKIPGVQNALLPCIGHPTSIIFANTLWSRRIVQYIRKKGREL